MKKKLFAVPIAALVLSMSINTAIAAECTFKKNIDSVMTEVDKLTSGEIFVCAPKLKTAEAKGIFSGASAKVMLNDGITAATADGNPLNALDGDNDTEVGAEEKNWNLLITLEKEKSLDNISVMFSDTVYPWRFTIETKTETGDWVMIKDVNKNKKGGLKTYDFETVTAKYIRITNAASDVRQMKICEVGSTTEDVGGEEQGAAEKILVAGLYNKELNRMYDFKTKLISSDMSEDDMYVTINVDEELTGLPEVIPEQENLLKGATGIFLSNANGAELSASSHNGVESVPSHAFDGDATTISCAGMEWTYTLQADMGEVKTVGKIVVNFSTHGYPISYDILTSADGEAWSTVAGESGNSSAGIREFSFEPVQARWIRVRDNIAQTDVQQMNIAELEAYERNFGSDYEVRAFMIESMENKTPFGDLAVLR